MEIRVLGPLGATDAGRQIALGGRRQRSVLAGLVVHAGETVPIQRLIEAVWGEDAPPSARKSLQTYVSRLRRSLGDGLIASVGAGYVLRVGAEHLDALRFEQLAAQGRRLLGTDPAAALDALTEGLGLWRGAPLSDIDPIGDVLPYVERLQEERLVAVEDRIEAALTLGQHRQLVGELRTLVEANPLRERLCQQLMLALYRSGRQPEALEVFHLWRRTLADELGLEPSATLRELETRILRQDPTLDLLPTGDGPVSRPPPTRNPYKGLRAFAESDAADFFGREALVERLVARVDAGTRFLALVGPSGSGKSSIALAGLAPALRHSVGGPERLIARMSPGTHPFAQLEAALARAAPAGAKPPAVVQDDDLALLRAVLTIVPDERTELLLVIDQFEELLTGTIAESTVGAFVRNLVEALEDPHGQLLVAVTLRSDFFDEALRQPDLAGLLDDGTVNVPPLSAVELQAAVVRPARAAGLRVEPELVTELVTETAQHPGALPLLQFVLTELADQAEDGALTFAALQAAGGIQGTLGQHAEQVLARLSAAGQAAARQIFLRLVALNEVGEPTRRVVLVDELTLPGADEHLRTIVLDALVVGRLLTYGREPRSGRATVEVTHEAVLRAWPRCVRWVEEATTDIRVALDLERAAADWNASNRSADYLLTGSRLELAESWEGASELATSPSVAALLQASLARRQQEQRAELARAERERVLERRSVNRLRTSVAVLALLVGVAAVLSAFLVARSNEADRQRSAALAAASEGLVRQLSFAAVAEAGRDPELSLLLALHAVRTATLRGDPIPTETVEAFHWGLQELKVPYPVAEGDLRLLVGTEGTRGAYELPTPQLVELALANVSRELTPDECAAFLQSGACPTLAPVLTQDIVPPAAAPRPTQPDVTLAGTTVRIGIGPGNEDYFAFREEFRGFTEATGIDVVHVQLTNAPELVGTGELPELVDIATVQGHLVVAEAAAGNLIDLSRYLPYDQLVADYGAHLTSIGRDAAPAEASGPGVHSVPWYINPKSLIWYDPERFAEAGYTVPTTWQQLLQLSDRIVADGGTPWCFAEEEGWPTTDWIEDALLHDQGPEVYDGWVAGRIPFNDPRVRGAFERVGELAFADGYVHGGIEAATRTSFRVGGFPLVEDPPGCWMYRFGSFIHLVLPPEVVVGEDVAAFPTPSIDDAYRESMVGATNHTIVYADRPEIREVMRFITSPQFGVAHLNEFPSLLIANRRFDPAEYPDWRRDLAPLLAQAQAADLFRDDGSDLMPSHVGSGPIWDGMIDYLRGGPSSLDEVLTRLDAAWEE
jgi:DNA-binding SARP family transcriptional activator/ABC-type glycerol-3-phosphate transport system substrate-binding protein